MGDTTARTAAASLSEPEVEQAIQEIINPRLRSNQDRGPTDLHQSFMRSLTLPGDPRVSALDDDGGGFDAGGGADAGGGTDAGGGADAGGMPDADGGVADAGGGVADAGGDNGEGNGGSADAGGTPDAGFAQPDAGAAPDAGSAPPDYTTAPPDAGTAAPDDGTAAPDGGSASPDDSTGTSDSGSAPADYSTAPPDAGTVTVVMPAAGTVSPAAGGTPVRSPTLPVANPADAGTTGKPDAGTAVGPPLAPGDHVWYWNGRTSDAAAIPRATWFPGSTGDTDYQGHGKEIYQYVVYADQVKRGQPHMRSGPGTFAWINNNPGNLTAGGTSVGEIPGKRNWHNFLIFASVDDGMAAIPKFLKANGYGGLSILDAFRKYAPASDGNDPDHYAQVVVNAVGKPVTLSTKINDLTDDQLKEVAKAIAQMEGSIPGDTLKRDDASIPDAIRARISP